MSNRFARQGRLGTVGYTTIALALTLAALAAPSSAGASVIVVDTLDDTGTNNCTLRSAIAAASDNVATGDCEAGSASDRIAFAVSGTIELSSELPLIEGALRIDGPSSDELTVDRESIDPFRIFTVASGASVEIAGMTITDGRVEGASALGGGIFNQGELTLHDMRLTDNTAVDHPGAVNAYAYGGGIYNASGAFLEVVDSQIDNNSADTLSTGTDVSNGFSQAYGGAVYSSGILTINRSTISNNSTNANSSYYAWAEGTIDSYGSTWIVNSTINANEVAAFGGTSHGLTFGAAVTHLSFTGELLDIDQTTIVGNASNSGGLTNFEMGAVYFNGSGSVESSTFAQNSANDGNGIYLNSSDGIVTVENTILADPESNGLCYATNGTLTSTGHNLTEGSACTATPAASDKVGDPLLGGLGENGGPTETMLPAITSLAIDSGVDASGFGGDQRGDTRPRDLAAVGNVGVTDTSDIGAVERQSTRLVPRSIDFGPIAPGGSLPPQPALVELEGAGPYLLSQAAITGDDAGDFTISGDACSEETLDSVTTVCLINVTFTPAGSTAGTRSAFLTLSDDGSTTPMVVELIGSVLDVVDPTTTIKGLALNAAKRRATLRFSGNDDQAGAIRFECSLDGKPFAGCSSPKVYKRLKLGRHTFKVRARDIAGNLDKSPAVKRFKLIKKKRRH